MKTIFCLSEKVIKAKIMESLKKKVEKPKNLHTC